MEMVAANPERPAKLYLADDRAIRLRTRGAAPLLGQRIQPGEYRSLRRSLFRKILSRVRPVPNENELQGRPATIPRRAAVPELTAAHRATGWLVTLEETWLHAPGRDSRLIQLETGTASRSRPRRVRWIEAIFRKMLPQVVSIV